MPPSLFPIVVVLVVFFLCVCVNIASGGWCVPCVCVCMLVCLYALLDDLAVVWHAHEHDLNCFEVMLGFVDYCSTYTCQ